jgi:hypothetical protein
VIRLHRPSIEVQLAVHDLYVGAFWRVRTRAVRMLGSRFGPQTREIERVLHVFVCPFPTVAFHMSIPYTVAHVGTRVDTR